ncbi:MAG: single-stranded-DNA-specific exonuclease RecJ [Clostridia bacterium]|nr:single-stranded-DNA-specific exonuclease RecJ [Clostridia bacterium]
MDFKRNNKFLVEQSEINRIVQKFKVSQDVAQVLLMRGFNDDEQIQKFLYPQISDMHDPYLFKDMEKVVERIKNAIKTKEKILIFGDYDVDGITSSFILLDYFKSVGCKADTFLPNRYSDGYGLTHDAVNYVINQFNPSLIITVDCGISGYEEIEYIKSKGIDVIVTDHHDCPELIPNCLVIDAKIPNQTYPFRELCGAGVALKVVEALAGRDIALKYLPVCAIATVSDIVPLVDENRVIVKYGLDRPLNAFPDGIVALCKELKLGTKITSQDVSFKIAPKLNASGRMGDANHSLRLYIEKDRGTIKRLITQLLEYNTERQDLCNVVYVDCINELKKVNLADKKVIVLANKNWNIGILGIVAARITDEFKRPTFLLGEEGGFYKGSCRSIEGLNVHEVLTQLNDILTSFGGHVMAAGMTIAENKIDEFKTRLENIIETQYADKFFEPYYEYDLDIDVKDICIERLRGLEILEPYGCQNNIPTFKIQFEKGTITPMKKNSNHLTIQLPTINLLAFNSGQYFNLVSQSSVKECIAELWVDTFRGVSSCKGIVKHLQIAGVPNVGAERIGGEYIKQLALQSNGKKPIYSTYKKQDLDVLLNDTDNKIYGTLVIANTLQSYREFKALYADKYNIICNEYLNITDSCGYNTLCLCPSLENDYRNFNRIILLDSVLDEAYVVFLNENSNAKVLIPSSTPFLYAPFKMIDLSRKTFGEYFNLIKKSSKSCLVAFDDYNYFNKIKRTQHDLNYVQFVACLLTFKQLNLLEINDEIGNFYITLKSTAPTQLNQSQFYNKLELILKSY